MNSFSTNSLNEVLTRSKRLEQVLPFRPQLTVPTILQRSRNISRSTDDSRVGYLLLAQQHVDIENAKEILDSITDPRIISDNYISFQDRSDFSYQDVIVKSIANVQKSTEKLNDDLIYKTFMQKKQSSIAQIEHPISVPIHNLDPTRLEIYGDSLRMELVERSKFYCNLLPQFNENMALVISEAILSTKGKLNNNESQYFADTFKLIHYINNPSNTIKGASAFLEKQKKLLIEKETQSNLLYLERGGEIGIIPTIKAYLRYRKNPHAESPYAVIFYAIRCGELKAASDFASEAEVDKNVAIALQLYSNRNPLGIYKNTLMGYLNSEFESTRSDIFKVLTLSILTKTRRKITSEKKTTIQDWLWFELQFTTDLKTLASKLISEYQSDYPELRGQILLMIGSFDEAASWFLSQCEKTNYQDNLHIVLCLHHLGFISSDVLLEPLIKYAIEVFKTDQKSAIQYLSLITEHDKRIDSIAKLVIKADNGCQMFEERIEPDRSYMISPINEVLLPDEVNEVIGKACIKARQLDLYDIVIDLYLLRDDYMGILKYDCIKLKQIIKSFSNLKLLDKINQHYSKIVENQGKENEFNVDYKSLVIMQNLYKLAAGCEFVRGRNYESAVTVFESTDLFPSIGISAEIMQQTFSNMPEDIKEVMPFVLVPALASYYNLYLSDKDTNLSNREKLRERSESIRQFASVIDLDSEMQALILKLCSSIK